MARLYVIGNGFDLHFGLKTGVLDFVSKLQNQSIYSQIDGSFDNFLSVMEEYGIDWSNYELSLAEMDLEAIENQNMMMPDYMSDYESDREGVIYSMQVYLDGINDAIDSALKEMVEDANYELEEKMVEDECLPRFISGDAILSFNYTSTIEMLFELPEDLRILHIHGLYEDNDPLIFGYKDSDEKYKRRISSYDDGDYYTYQQQMAIYKFYCGWKKAVQKEKLNSFLGHCQEIDEVVVLGHSMGAVDSWYLEQIEKVLHPTIWHVSYHGADEVKDNSQQYSFKSKIRFFAW